MSCVNFIANFNDKVKGYVYFHQCSKTSNVMVIFDLYNMQPNMIHACHIHEYGDISNGCESLGLLL